MAKIAKEQGINKIIATPHYHPEFKYAKGQELKKIYEEFKKELKENKIDIELYIGNEIYFTYDLIDKISELEPIKVIFRDSAFGDDISLKQNSIHRLNVLIEENNKNTTHVVEFI